MKILEAHKFPGLPKWPSVYITGKSVTPEQAKDIIFRTEQSVQSGPTDYFGGNDRAFQARLQKDFGWDTFAKLQDYIWSDRTKSKAELAIVSLFNEMDKNTTCSVNSQLNIVRDAWMSEMQIVETEYVYNNYLSTAYIGGPCGWMNLDGTILFEGHNYGKWPNVSDIQQDWAKLVCAFPYLDLVCTLFSGESCEDNTHPVVTFVVRDGLVHVCEPDRSLHSAREVPEVSREVRDAQETARFRKALSDSYKHEHGWPEDWIVEFSAKSRAALRKAAPRFMQEQL